ncbi:amidohydrolase [candidate division WOR-3 bacterium]|nr:amidohydrolase [candidate division WOR-3 bacterium]
MILFRNALVHSPPKKSIHADVLIEAERIAKVGRIKPMAEANVHESKTILPAYIDSHIHLLEYGLSLLFLDLREAKSREEVLDLVSSRLPEARNRGFLYAFNLAPERLAEIDWQPQTGELDTIDKRIPIFIRREDGHSVFLNRAARRWLLYDQPIEGASDPISGRFNELAVERMQERIPVELRKEAFLAAGKYLVSKGVTGAAVLIGDSAHLEDVEIYREIASKVGIEAVLFPQNPDVEKVCELKLSRLGGCILIDGSFGSRTAALREPYTDAPGNMGILYFSNSELANLVKCANEAGLQMTFHAIGDEAIEQIISAYEKFIEPVNPLRHRIEHAELMPPDLIQKAMDLNLILGVQPMFEAIWGQDGGLYEKRLGERRRWTNPFRSQLEQGLILAAGSDAPITTPDPAIGIKAFLTHPIPEERISPQQALAAYTHDAAFGMHLEAKVGSIEEGLQADLLVFDKDPLKTLDFHPKAVIRRGKVVHGSI